MGKICLISANLGRFEAPANNVPQSMDYGEFIFTDSNFRPRFNAMSSRLQAKIPKFFGWQLAPGYEYYLWLDGRIYLSRPDSIEYFYNQCQGYDIAVMKHPHRPDIRQEVRFTRKGVKQGAIYIEGRYANEMIMEQYRAIQNDKDYVDDVLYTGGVFVYRNTPVIHNMMKEWWYNVTRYVIQDQISFPYVVKKSGAKVNVIPGIYSKCPYISASGHLYRDK